MKRGKDDEKIVGPMFPRLHVNDTEKGGPKAPPRNKMALYEQLSIPSQRFNPGVLPLDPNNPTSLVPSASSTQGIGHDRSLPFPLHLPPSAPAHLAERLHPCQSDAVNLNTPLAQLEQRKKVGDEDDFMVPIFVPSGMGQCHIKTPNNRDMEGLTPLSPSGSYRSVKHQNSCDKDPKRTSSGLSLRQEVTSQSEENPKVCVSSRDYTVKSTTNLSTRGKIVGSSNQANACSNQQHQCHPGPNFSRIHDNDTFLQQEYRAGTQPEDVGCGDGFPDKLTRDEEKGNASRPRTDYHSGIVNSNPNEPDNYGEYRGDKTCGSLQTGTVDGSDDVSEASMVDSISALDISPDDVVEIIGQKHFWKARRAIANQQRVFAVQVFELHRLIKVQRLIAGSPHLLLEGNVFLGRPALKGSPAKKLPLEFVVKPPQHTVKRKDDSEKPNHNMECSAENAVGKASLSSVKHGSQPSSCGPYLGAPTPVPVTDAKIGPWCFNQPPGHQWLVPVMSPSEGLIYKPYPGPGFMGPAYGGCGPMGPSPMTGNFLNPAYGVPASHHHHQGMGLLPGAPSVGHGYFPPYGFPVFNPVTSGLAVEQVNPFAGPGSNGQTGQLSGGRADINMQHQSSCNVPSQKDRAISRVKLQASKDSELQGSTASSPGERAQGFEMGHIAEGRDALPLFPMAPLVPEGVRQVHDADQPARVIKVVPHNRRSATESAARIFQSIQQERKQYDSV